MRQGRFNGDVAEGAEIALQKRSARSGQDDALHFVLLAAAERLVHGVVLGIDRKNLAAVFACRARHDVARGHQNFLVGDADPFPRLQCGHCTGFGW